MHAQTHQKHVHHVCVKGVTSLWGICRPLISLVHEVHGVHETNCTEDCSLGTKLHALQLFSRQLQCPASMCHLHKVAKHDIAYIP